MAPTGKQEERDGHFARSQVTVEQLAIDYYEAVFRATKGQAINREAAAPAVSIRPLQSALPPHEIAAVFRLPDRSLEYFAAEPLPEGLSHLASSTTPRPLLVSV